MREESLDFAALVAVFSFLGKRWNGLIIALLLDGPSRFSEIAHGVPGVSERVLAARLTELAEAGIVQREVFAGPPVSVQYDLTSEARELRKAFVELERWSRASLGATHDACHNSPAED